MIEFFFKYVKWFLALGFFYIVLGLFFFFTSNNGTALDFILMGAAITGISGYHMLKKKNLRP